MTKEVRCEMYRGSEKIKPLAFFVYDVTVTSSEQSKDSSLHTAFNTELRFLNAYHSYEDYKAVTDYKRIYTQKAVRDDLLVHQKECTKEGRKSQITVELTPRGREEVPLSNTQVYEQYLSILIHRNLLIPTYNDNAGRIRKIYRPLEKSVVTDRLYHDKNGRLQFNEVVSSSANPKFRVTLEVNYAPHVRPDGTVFLELDTHTHFLYTHTLYTFKKEYGDKLSLYNDMGLQFKYVLPVYQFTGHIVDEKDIQKDKFEYKNREEILEHYRQYDLEMIKRFVDTDPKDDEVVFLMNHRGDVLSFLTGTVRPIMTTEILRSLDSRFSATALEASKRHMGVRYAQDKTILSHIGKIAEFDNLSFSVVPVAPQDIGHRLETFAEPKIVIGGQEIVSSSSKSQVLRGAGCFQPPRLADDEKYHITVVAPPEIDYIPLLSYLYVSGGLKANLPAGKGYLDPEYIALQTDTLNKPLYFEEIADMAKENCPNVQAMLCVLPRATQKESSRVREGLKKAAAKRMCPTQMIEYGHALDMVKTYCGQPGVQKNPIYTAGNVVLGLIVKTGGVPFALADLPEKPDLFIGIDVGTQEAGIHYPSCSVAVTGAGKYLGFIPTSKAIKGEKITTACLEEMFGSILTAYRKEMGTYPSTIVIHRDGFSHEDDDWYKEYFASLGIAYSIFEVRKSGAPRIMGVNGHKVVNPDIGKVLIDEVRQSAYMVTTHPYHGAQRPIQITKTCGDVPLLTGLQQIYALTKVDPRSTWNVRLPITTRLADLACKAKDYVPQGVFCHELYFA